MDINVKGKFTRQDILNAFFTHLKPTRYWIAIRLVLVGVMVLILFFAFFQGTSTWWLYLLVLIVVVSIISPWWLPYLQTMRFNPNNPLLKPLTGQISDEGMSLHGYQFNSTIKWESFTHYKKAGDVVLLYQGSNAFNFLARSLFESDADWEACVSIVAKYLPAG